MSDSVIASRETLIAHLNAGNEVKYMFFWGHTPKEPAILGKECFSQWYPAAFTIDDIVYPTAEHYMMAEKARLFGDHEVLVEILQAQSPGEAKKLGRKVRDFSEETWRGERFAIVVRGNVAKFSQHPELREFLCNTGERVLVEASPRDRIWGIGMAASHPDATNPNQWRGQNLLGFALMVARSQI